MNKDQENKKKVNPIIKDDNAIDIESKLNNDDSENRSEIEDLYSILENDKKEIMRLINENNWWKNRCNELENYIFQFTNIGLNNVGNYNQICTQDYKILDFFSKTMKELKTYLNNDKYIDKLIEDKDKEIESLRKMVNKLIGVDDNE